MPTSFRETTYSVSDPSHYERLFGKEEEVVKRKMELFTKVVEEFEKSFNPSPDEEVYCFFVPGRVEVFGKHTDYAGGHSILFAMDLGFFCVSKVNDLKKIRIKEIDPAVKQAKSLAASSN